MKFLFVSIFLSFSAIALAQLPTTTLRAMKLRQPAANQLEFTVYLKNTSAGNIEFAGGQFHFSFNKAILNGGAGTLTIPSSGLGTLTPKNPTVVTTTTPGTLRTASPTPPGAGGGFVIQSGDSVKVATFRLTTSASAFSQVTPDIVIRNSTAGNPYTKFGAYINSVNTLIESASTYYNVGNQFNTGGFSISPSNLTQVCFGDTVKSQIVTLTSFSEEGMPVTISDSLVPGLRMRQQIKDEADSSDEPDKTGWLSLNPTSATIPPGGTAQFTVTFTPGSLAFGVHNAIIIIKSSDSTKILPVQLEKYLIDSVAPLISYRLLHNTSSSANRQVTGVTITDAGNGVDTSVSKRPRVYYKKAQNANTYYDNLNSTDGWKWTEATNTTTPFAFTIDYSKLYGGTPVIGDTIQYFIVAQDKAYIPNVGKYTATFATNPNSVALSVSNFPVSGTKYYQLSQTISGTLAIGSGQTYTTLTGAGGLFETLNESVITGDVTVNITSNLNETGAVALKALSEEGVGGYRLTIKSSAAATRTIFTSAAGGMLRLENVSRVTFDGMYNGAGNYLTISSGAQTGAPLQIISSDTTEKSSGIRIQNCTFQGTARSNPGAYGLVAGGDNVGEPGKTMDSLIVSGNVFKRVYTAIYLGAADGYSIRSFLIHGNSVGINDTIQGFGKNGIVLSNAQYGTISQNVIQKAVGLNRNPTGIIINPGVRNVLITRNDIHSLKYTGTAGYGGRGVFINSGVSDSGLVFCNNIIYDLGGDGSVQISDNSICGIAISGQTSFASLYYNTVYLSGTINKVSATNDKSACLYAANAVTGLAVVNNIFANSIENSTGNSKAYAVYCEASSSAFNSIDHNNYFVSGPEGILGYFASDRINLDEWRSATGKDSSSLSTNPYFINSSSLQPPDSANVFGRAKVIPGISDDYLSVARDLFFPTIGAYEAPINDNGGPRIIFTLLNKTFSTSSRTLSGVIISDPSTVNYQAGSRPRIYFKKKSDANIFGANSSSVSGWKWKEATESQSPVSFLIDYSLLYSGVGTPDTIQYFIVAQDRATQPNVGASPYQGFSATSVSSIISAPMTPHQYRIIGPPLSGTYTVGRSKYLPEADSRGSDLTHITESSDVFQESSQDANALEDLQKGVYADLSNAVFEATERGLSGPVTFLLTDTVYSTNERFPILLDFAATEYKPTNTNTLTIKPGSGINAIIRGSAENSALIKIAHGDNIRIDGSNITNGGTRNLTLQYSGSSSNSGLVWLSSTIIGDGCLNNVIKNCNIYGNGDGSTAFGISVSGGVPGSSSPAGQCNSNTMMNNIIAGVKTAISITGSTLATPDSNNSIRYNTLGLGNMPLSLGGVYAKQQKYMNVSNNIIQNVVNGTTNDDVYGIQLTNVILSSLSANRVSQVKFHSLLSGRAYGIILDNKGLAFGTSSSNVLSNNMISALRTRSNSSLLGCAGLQLLAGKNDKIYFNTIYINADSLGTNSNVYSAAFANGSSSGQADTLLDFRNNILQISGTVHPTGKIFAHYTTASTYAGSTINSNCLYSNIITSGTAYVGYFGSACSTLAQWQSASMKDSNSVVRTVFIVSASDAHLSGTTIGDKKLKGTPILGYSTDIDGETRHASHPYIGADEIMYAPLFQSLSLTVLIEGFYDPVSNTMLPDTIWVLLRKKDSPYTITDSTKILLSANGTALVNFTGESRSNDSVYVVIKHRNSIQTWSSNPLNFPSGSLSYNFSLSKSSAYGDNMIRKGSRYCIYSGDTNQDNWVNFSDLVAVDNAMYWFVFGYIPADVTGDLFVDYSDMAITDNNSFNFTSWASPLSQKAALPNGDIIITKPPVENQQADIKKESIKE